MAYNPIRVEMRMDTSRLDAMITHSTMVADACSLDAANQIVNHIKSNWSSASPSSPGRPPAVVEGELDRSIRVDKKSFFSKLSGRGSYKVVAYAEYAAALELGKVNAPNTILPRPYMRPAVEKVSRNLKRTFFPIINPRNPAYMKTGGGSSIGEILSIIGAVGTGIFIGYEIGDE